MRSSFTLVVILLLAPLSVQADLLDSLKGKFKIAKCLKTNTQQMCTFEGIYDASPKKTLKKEAAVSGLSQKYILRPPNVNWRHLWPGDKKRKEDLVLMHKSKRAFVQVEWFSKPGDYKKTAKEHFREMIAKLKVEPTVIPLDVWPYQKNGVFYEMCYRTNKKTQECFYAAAANIPSGMVSFFSVTQFDEKLIEDIVFLIASLDVPKAKAP